MAPTSQHTNWHIRALTVPGPDTDLSLYVAFDNVRYLFGCGEGTQRAFVQKRLSMRGTAGLFLPEGGAAGRAGLAGLIMTACDGGIKKLSVVGPPDTTQNLAALRASVYRGEINLDMRPHITDGSSDNIYPGSNLHVRSIALRPTQERYQRSGSRSPNDEDSYHATQRREAGALAQNHIDVMFNHDGTGKRPDFFGLQPVPLSEDTATQMVYVCQAPDIPGKFNLAKAMELGVPNGPLRGKLVKGETIEVDDVANPGQKRVIRPEECVAGAVEGAVMIVVNCSEQILPALLASNELDMYRDVTAGAQRKNVAVMVYRAPAAVWQNEEFGKWMKSFGPDTQHLIATTDGYSHEAAFTSSAWNVLQLSTLDEELFQPIHADATTTMTTTNAAALPPNATFLQSGHRLQIQPKGPLEIVPHGKHIPYPSSPALALSAREAFATDMPDFAVECAKAREAVRADRRWTEKVVEPGSDMTVTTLGTGSAIPSKYRNVSSTHLHVPGLGGILLDCGEGTLGQLRRRYGFAGLRKVYMELRMVFVSHMHADHHLGLQAILQDRFANGITSRLYLVAPIHIAISMSEAGSWSYGVPQEALDNVVWIDNAALEQSPLPGIPDSPPPSSPGPFPVEQQPEATPSIPSDQNSQDDPSNPSTIPLSSRHTASLRRWPRHDILSKAHKARYSQIAVQALLSDLSLSGIRTPRVAHRGYAWALILHHSSDWKVVYSGDTKPCERLVRAGRGATLLIHEATLEDDKPDVALEKGHATFSQAIEVGERMGAGYVLLNHFSQRYPKLPKSRRQRVSAAAQGEGEVVEAGRGQEVAEAADGQEHQGNGRSSEVQRSAEEAQTIDTPTTTAADITKPIEVISEVPTRRRDEMVVSISYDFMSTRIDQMWRMEHYLDAAEILFKDAEGEEEGDGVEGGVEGEVRGAVEGERNATVDGGKAGKGGKGKGDKGKGKGGKGTEGKSDTGKGGKGENGKKGALQGTGNVNGDAAENQDAEGKGGRRQKRKGQGKMSNGSGTGTDAEVKAKDVQVVDNAVPLHGAKQAEDVEMGMEGDGTVGGKGEKRAASPLADGDSAGMAKRTKSEEGI